MKVIILCPQISGSSFLVCHSFGKIVSKKHDVKFIGPTFGLKPFLHDPKINIQFVEPFIKQPIQLGMFLSKGPIFNKLIEEEFDVIHAFKLLPNTAPIAAKIKQKENKPFILTIDDYDPTSPKNPIKRWILQNSEKAYKFADAITVSSTFLQKIYGGEVVYQVSDEKVFNPKKHSGKKIRKKYKVEDKIVITHIGTIFPHKGIDFLIKAVQELKNPDVKLMLFEAGSNIEYYKSISGDETIWVKQINFNDVPEYTAASDIYIIPTRDTMYARAEIPRKIFDAMAMGKPIVASNISDIPIFLDNGKCGILTKPDSLKSLKDALSHLIEDKSLREKLGRKARSSYLKHFSYKILEQKLNKIYSQFM